MAMLAFGLITCFMSGADSAPCPSDTVELHINSTADVRKLADALSCVGDGVFNITWHGSLTINEIIEISNEKNIAITGAGFASFHGEFGDDIVAGAVIDARSDTGIFSVSNGCTLRLDDMVLVGGNSENGGAVTVISSSALILSGCTLTRNNASNGGETPPLEYHT